MGTLEWNEQFSVGVEELDRQHKKIIKLLNQLDEIHPSHDNYSEKLSEILTNMRRYAEDHFGCEEETMRRYEYPDLEQQINMHQQFTLQMARYSIALMDEQPDVAEKISAFLSDWWQNHILDADMKYKDFFSGKITGNVS